MNTVMSTIELKNKVIAKIQTLEDDDLLKEVYRLLAANESDVVYQFSAEQKTVVNEARMQIKNGQSLTHEQASNEIDEWLEK